MPTDAPVATGSRAYFEWLAATEATRRASRRAGITVIVPSIDEWIAANA